MLFGTMAEAEMLKGFIDTTGCGESCRRDHLAVEVQATPDLGLTELIFGRRRCRERRGFCA